MSTQFYRIKVEWIQVMPADGGWFWEVYQMGPTDRSVNEKLLVKDMAYFRWLAVWQAKRFIRKHEKGKPRYKDPTLDFVWRP